MKWNKIFDIVLAIIFAICLFVFYKNSDRSSSTNTDTNPTETTTPSMSYEIKDEIYQVENGLYVVLTKLTYDLPQINRENNDIIIDNDGECNFTIKDKDDGVSVEIESMTRFCVEESIRESKKFDLDFFYSMNHESIANSTVYVDGEALPNIEFGPLTQDEIDAAYNYLYDLYEIDYYSPHTKFPQYFQSDYGLVPFSGGTVRSHGCGISSFSMVASYLLNETITPDILARQYNRSNPAAGMEDAMKGYGLIPEAYYGDAIHDHMWQAIEDGRPVIALVQKESIFTETGHFILIAGTTEDGNYIVYDPNKFNYDIPWLKEKFKTGFTKEEITLGLKGCYIFNDTPVERTNETLKEILENVENMLDKQNLT